MPKRSAQPKRKPGGQPGNTNALKHGFYSEALAEAARAKYEEARERGPIDLSEEVAICRERLYRLIEASPDRIDLLARLVNGLARLAATHFHLTGSDADRLTTAMHNVLQDIEATLGPKGDD